MAAKKHHKVKLCGMGYPSSNSAYVFFVTPDGEQFYFDLDSKRQVSHLRHSAQKAEDSWQDPLLGKPFD